MTWPTPARFIQIAVLVVISFAPQFLTVGVFGEINFWFLALLWLVLFLCYFMASESLARVATIIAALAMAIPPVPNYVFPSEISGWQLTWIGWKSLLEGGGLYGIAFFFVFYALLFGAVAWLLRRRK